MGPHMLESDSWLEVMERIEKAAQAACILTDLSYSILRKSEAIRKALTFASSRPKRLSRP